eukprot:319265-Prorocentrum_minimum.AAC.9
MRNSGGEPLHLDTVDWNEGGGIISAWARRATNCVRFRGAAAIRGRLQGQKGAAGSEAIGSRKCGQLEVRQAAVGSED